MLKYFLYFLLIYNKFKSCMGGTELLIFNRDDCTLITKGLTRRIIQGDKMGFEHHNNNFGHEAFI